ncbi:MAG: 6-pyruvoyl-tetrahydropterin synthase [Dehalococcoidia bacterium]|nr:6-pyruvoyl-tetrahydropterin synthase [Dehalococcoidia bacterium]
MGSDYEGDAAARDVPDDLHDFIGAQGVQMRDELIGQDELGMLHERPGDDDTLALAAAEVVGLLARLMGDAKAVEHSLSFVHGFSGEVAQQRRQGARASQCPYERVLENAQAVHDPQVLRDVGDLAGKLLGLGRCSGNVLAKHGDGALLGPQQALQRL